jgi:hypothetical protein
MTARRGTGLGGLHLTHVIADVQRDHAWINCTPDDQLTEVLHRLGDRAVETFADARAALVADAEARLLTMIDEDVSEQQ